ncbi:chemotaxis protein CheC [Paludibacterium yongneupense]|uniref:chemotaxis protein CheC n=1 Tax=Paludibacterium yongneupense TaxID=400061 RepID=UPI000415F587|nr:chemotaxis protein CheC [Paludibacterium yongneupense]
MIAFNDFERDALSEVFNIGVGHAAATLSLMLGEPIQLAVPTVRLIARHAASAALAPMAGSRVCAVRQRFSGEITADALLIFPESNGLELVRAMVRQMDGDGLALSAFGEMEQEAVSEIGNIVLNAVMSTLCDMLGASFFGSLPELQIGSCDAIFGTGGDGAGQCMLMLHISFGIERVEVRGFLAFILDLPALDILKKSVARLVPGSA